MNNKTYTITGWPAAILMTFGFMLPWSLGIYTIITWIL